MLRTLDIYPEVGRKMEVYPFTMEDQWAKNLLCLTPSVCGAVPPRRGPVHLDREPITADTDKTVHLLIDGFGDMGQSLALHAALTAHYPNYERNHVLRTRITVIATNEQRDTFMAQYHTLFEHSYYRFLQLGDKRRLTLLHKPLYSAEREDFVDVEWEFVDGSLHDPALREKLSLWANDQRQLLTIALCNTQGDNTLADAMALPQAVSQRGVPVLVYTRRSGLADEVTRSGACPNIHPFGMEDCGYDISLPLLQMAKRLHYFYACSYGRKGVPTDMPADDVEREWANIGSLHARYANINNILTIATKMRSLGHDEQDWTRFYAVTREETELLSAVEHNRWCVDRLLASFRPPTKEERDRIAANIAQHIAASNGDGEAPAEYLKDVYKRQKVHYDLCAYRELGVDKTGQNVRVYDYDLTACIPLIANSYNEQTR